MKKLLLCLVLCLFIAGCTGGVCDENSPNYDPVECDRLWQNSLNSMQNTQQQQMMFQQQQQMRNLQNQQWRMQNRMNYYGIR